MLGRFRRLPRLVRVALLGGSALAALVAVLNLYVVLSEEGGATSDVTKEPHAQVALVLGAGLGPRGGLSQMLADRVKATVALWRAGKVDRILVSGDHHTWGYDEPDAMRRVLQRDGIPGRAIFTDHAGLDTWASMVRARRVFDVDTAIVVTQGFHMPRALFLAGEAGLHAHGLVSDLHDYHRQGQISDAREILARVKAVGQATIDGGGVILGPKIPITGDGRVSWGPQHPPRHHS